MEMKSIKIKEILESHAKYLENKKGGKRADLRGADLRGADLRGVNLSKANLQGADLSGARLFEANLSGADLSEANLSKADLFESVLSGTLLYRANLCEANLSKADLYGANFCKADLQEANLQEANLSGVNLSKAFLRDTNLYKAKNVPYIPMACPETGSFIAWKKAGTYIVKLLIPDDAVRSSANGRKCRANKAKVLEIQNIDGEKADINSVASNFDGGFIYKIGQEVAVPNFEKNRFIECAPGIHFFINRQEAVDY